MHNFYITLYFLVTPSCVLWEVPHRWDGPIFPPVFLPWPLACAKNTIFGCEHTKFSRKHCPEIRLLSTLCLSHQRKELIGRCILLNTVWNLFNKKYLHIKLLNQSGIKGIISVFISKFSGLRLLFFWFSF